MDSPKLIWFVAGLTIFVTMMPASEGLKCIECYPSEDSDCLEDEGNWNVTDCAGGDEAYCRKMIQNVEGKISYVRQCAKAKGGKEKLFYATANDVVKASVYHCFNEDKCNGGGRFQASTLLIVPIVSILALWF